MINSTLYFILVFPRISNTVLLIGMQKKVISNKLLSEAQLCCMSSQNMTRNKAP
jgi:hypothetical protein